MTPQLELRLPRWVGTMAGMLLILGVAGIAGLVIQARIIDQQARQINRLAEDLEGLTDQLIVVRQDRQALRELQDWRVRVTIAARSGWSSAVRYIVDNPLPMPDDNELEGGGR